MTLREESIQIIKKLRSAGYQALWAGGCVRDLIMRKKPHDFDIATSALPDEVEGLFKKTIPVGKKFGVILVQKGKHVFEVATFRKDQGYKDGRHPIGVKFTEESEDAQRRDFTINALYYDPVKKKTIDYVDGRKDIKNKLIRTVGNPIKRFEEDHLRLMRAIRFAANLGFSIDENTWKAIKCSKKLIKKVSAERVRDELIKMFTRPNAGEALILLEESGLLKEVLPDIQAMKGVEQPPEFHPEGDVFIHTKLLMDKLKDPSMVLAFGALLHDVGKPPTKSFQKGRICFYQHAELGAKMSEQILKKLKFSNNEIKDICSLVANHMKFAAVQEMRQGKLKRLISLETFSDELELHRIDCMSCHEILDNYYFMKKKVKQFKKEELKPKHFIMGGDLIKLGYSPGPVMGDIIEQCYEAQLENKITAKKEAISWVKKHFPR